jgi:hypothetical protein
VIAQYIVYVTWWPIFLFSKAPRLAVGSAQLSVERIPGAFPPGVKRSGRKAEHLFPSSVELKKESMPSWRAE